ncbi:hypothetical protein BOTBODRAFT_36757 [Botryobasidium botryosum FD-172 SS1]|uniref:G domain-containing protein n=1 Tax=Botryobasidium botryosum (strain FD-172 SS1) TaxID=930990 RepID=A0A067MDV1_BOTB1|nr:hypothetical protein BOTBODRAFT_36757 [Botryobasidium botryosum FD-172 SS1]
MAEIERPQRFRILIIGRANAGKTTILRAVCGVDEEPEVYDREGNKITPVVEPEAVPKVDHVEEAVIETHEAPNPGEVVSEVPETHHLEEVVSEAPTAHHPAHGEAHQAAPASTRSAFRSVWRSIYARLLCRPPVSILAAHLGEPEELNLAVSSPHRAPAPILATHPKEPEELNLAPSSPPRGEPKSILSPSSLRGEHRIDYELRFPSNPGFVFHDSRGFESGAAEELELVRKFIQEQAALGSMNKQLHAIWYCFPAESNRLMTAAEKEFFNNIDTGRVPVIAVFTKFDALDSAAFTALSGPGVPFEAAKAMAPKHATEKFNVEILPLMESLAHPPKAVVCLRNMHDRKTPAVIQKAVSELVERTEAALDTNALKILLVQAQCVNVEICMKVAVKRGSIMRAAQGQVDPMISNSQQKKLIMKIFVWFPSIWARAADAFINALTPWFSPLAPSMAPPLQALFVGITAVIIAADSFWPSSDKHGRQSITTSLALYFQSNRADHVRMAISEHLHCDESSLKESLLQIALNNHLASAGPESIALS